MNCFRWDMSCIAPPQAPANCETPLWFWLIAAAGLYMVAGKGK